MPDQSIVQVQLSEKTYMQRITPMLAGPALFAGFIIAIGYLSTESLWTILAGTLLFALYFIERLYWGRFYITGINELPGDKLKIAYMDKNKLKEYTGDKKSMRIQRSSVWYKMKADRQQYLTFKDEQKGFILKQFALGDWQETLINRFMDEWEPVLNKSKMIA